MELIFKEAEELGALLDDLEEIMQFDDDLLAIIAEDNDGAEGLAEIREGMDDSPELIMENLAGRTFGSRVAGGGGSSGGFGSDLSSFRKARKANIKAGKEQEKKKAVRRGDATAIEKIKSGVGKVKRAVRKMVGKPGISGGEMVAARKKFKDYAKMSDDRLHSAAQKGDRNASAVLRSREKRGTTRGSGAPSKGSPGTRKDKWRGHGWWSKR